ncbi:hypothetical protein RB598_005388 [Gaeumannomyces tritici]
MNDAGQNGGGDVSYFSDSENEERSVVPSVKSPSDILSGVYRGFKKSQENIARLTRQPSQRGLKSFSSRIQDQAHQHVRNLSLQTSLEKPLPEPPPHPASTPATPTPTNSVPQHASLAGVLAERLQRPKMERTNTMESMASMNSMSSMNSISSVEMPPLRQGLHRNQPGDLSMSSSFASLSRQEVNDEPRENLTPKSGGPSSGGPSPQAGQQQQRGAPSIGPAVGTLSSTGSSHLSGLMCNVHRTTGKEPHPLVGATTTILGDKLYVFGGRILSRSRPAPLTSDLYELDLIRRHWTKLDTTGDLPPPRYFHSMCPLGDTKLVCYGGMSPSPSQSSPGQEQQPEVSVMSDVHIYDVPTKTWTSIPTQDAPQGRYAHCACVLPSSANFASHKAPLSALHHNPSTGINEGRIGISIDGTGGAEMIVVGGQDGNNHYIEQISVFNLRSLKWTSTQPLGKSCGAYRSVVAPLLPSVTAKIGKANAGGMMRQDSISHEAREPGSSMLIYSNYNFLDVKLELQIRGTDGSLSERPMLGSYSPPGLRFPNGGVIDTHFVVSGTYLTSSKQEYALWALDLRNLTWSKIDAGGSVFSQGSWNRGVLWNRRNTFVVLGNRKRSLVDDYNHRRINFSNVCMVELEAFGFYDNPRKTAPMSGFVSASSPYTGPGLSLARKAGTTAGGRSHSRASEELGEKALIMRELADMDILCIGGERIPVNSRIVARRWGPYFVQLLREGTATQDGNDVITLRSTPGATMRASVNTVTHSSGRNTMESNMSMGTMTSGSSSASNKPPSTAGTSISGASAGLMSPPADLTTLNSSPTPRTLPPNARPRCLYLPHTYLTLQALLHFLYTSSLAPPSSPLCTPQILCSLLQIARPYRIDGLLEAVVERLHTLLDSRNAAAVFNATAMAAGGGRGIDGSLNPNFFVPSGQLDPLSPTDSIGMGGLGVGGKDGLGALTGQAANMRLHNGGVGAQRPESAELSATTSVSGSEWSSELDSERGAAREVWDGELSSVIGLQKRGLRGLMEGRRMRERTGTNAPVSGSMSAARGLGLGIAGSS